MDDDTLTGGRTLDRDEPRFVGLGGVAVAATPLLLSFGPFMPGDPLRSLGLYLASDSPLDFGSTTLSLRLSGNRPATAAAFAVGRSLLLPESLILPLVLTDALVQSELGYHFDIPLYLIPEKQERFLSLLISTSDAAANIRVAAFLARGMQR